MRRSDEMPDEGELYEKSVVRVEHVGAMRDFLVATSFSMHFLSPITGVVSSRC